MRIERETIIVKLESPDGDALFTFDQEMPLNRLYLERAEIEKIEDPLVKMARFNKLFLSSLVSVEGLQHPDGEAVTTEQIKNLEVYPSFINKVVDAFLKAKNAKEDKNSKKDDTSSE
jgi:hypothetical protein